MPPEDVVLLKKRIDSGELLKDVCEEYVKTVIEEMERIVQNDWLRH